MISFFVPDASRRPTAAIWVNKNTPEKPHCSPWVRATVFMQKKRCPCQNTGVVNCPNTCDPPAGVPSRPLQCAICHCRSLFLDLFFRLILFENLRFAPRVQEPFLVDGSQYPFWVWIHFMALRMLLLLFLAPSLALPIVFLLSFDRDVLPPSA